MENQKRFSFILKLVLVVLLALTTGLVIIFFCHTRVTDHIDGYVYDLPFAKGTKCRVVQGYGGLFSHRYIAAIDFAMPVGTIICAARAGTIYAYKDDSNEGGVFSKYWHKANFIIIKHNDGSFGCYWHLQLNGVLVKNGYVKQGQPIGLSGATGQVFRPHLHFSVKRKLNYEMDAFVKTKFRTSGGVMLLEKGNLYERPME